MAISVVGRAWPQRKRYATSSDNDQEKIRVFSLNILGGKNIKQSFSFFSSWLGSIHSVV
jgi:hypothetical protein